MQIRYTSRAERDVATLDDWWRTNRPAAPDLCWNELNEALVTLATVPNGAPLYVARRRSAVRRILSPESRHHVYFRVDRRQQRVMILAVWGATRGKGPRL